MRKIFVLFALMCSIYAHSQDVVNTEILKMDSIAASYFNEKQYASALNTYGELQKLLNANLTEGDSLVIDNYVKQANCYSLLDKFDKAIELTKNAVALQKKYHGTDKLYAFYLDNLSVYQNVVNDYESALKNLQEAENIYQKLGCIDIDFADILAHKSTSLAALEKYTDAISTELRALDLKAAISGVHSDEYIEEAPYLVNYYTAAGMMDEAATFENKIKELKKEAEEGIADIPSEINFKTAAETKEHKWEVLRCADYILGHCPGGQQTADAMVYIGNWIEKTEMLRLSFGSFESNFVKNEKDAILLVAYLASCIKYAFSQECSTMDYNMFVNGLVGMLDFYNGCLEEKCISKNKFCDKLINDFEKDKIADTIKQLWAEKEREMKIAAGAAVVRSNME
jgi:tetratricopeptide (TPR) repeat protein